jgi:hypothetical protein
MYKRPMSEIHGRENTLASLSVPTRGSPDSHDTNMAKKSKSSKPAAPSLKHPNEGGKQSSTWLSKEIGLLLLSVAVILAALFFLRQSDDGELMDRSVWSEVYMPEKHGIGVIAKKNISVRPFVYVSSIYNMYDLARHTHTTRKTNLYRAIGYGAAFSSVLVGATGQGVAQQETCIRSTLVSWSAT